MPTQITDVNRLATDIQTADAALPGRLSDYWLTRISQDLESYFQTQSEEALIGPLALVLLICQHKADTVGHPLEISHETLYQYLKDYHLELGLETLRRKTRLHIAPATLDTLFTDREVKVTRPWTESPPGVFWPPPAAVDN